MSTSQIRNVSTLSNAQLHAPAIKCSRGREPPGSTATDVYCSRATSLDQGGNGLSQAHAPLGIQTDNPCSHKPASVTMSPALCICLLMSVFSSPSELSGACLWLAGRIVWKQEMGVLMCLCVSMSFSHVSGPIWSMKADGWVTRLRAFSLFLLPENLVVLFYFYPYLCFFVAGETLERARLPENMV